MPLSRTAFDGNQFEGFGPKPFAQTVPSFAQSDEPWAGKVIFETAGARLSSSMLDAGNDDGTDAQRSEFHY
jgi:hypothetical protein